MLVSAKLTQCPSVMSLVKIWTEYYQVDLSKITIDNPVSYTELMAAASPERRASTAAKLHSYLVDNECKLAGIQTKNFYDYIPNVLDLREIKSLTKFSFLIYKKLLEIYQQQSLKTLETTFKIAISRTQKSPLSFLGIADIEHLATEIEPILLEFQKQHVRAKDWRALGFITTQFNFSNRLIIENSKLSQAEKILLSPYLKFIEEQVALPWQRVCAAAVRHSLSSPALNLVEKMFPLAQDISVNVIEKMLQLFPGHKSRRGLLSNPEITHSCIRDLNMFQAYLWLCLLEENMIFMEQELVPLCEVAVQSLDIKWELTQEWVALLNGEIMSRLQSEQQTMLLPYTQSMTQIFFNARYRLGATDNEFNTNSKPPIKEVKATSSPFYSFEKIGTRAFGTY